MASDDDPLARFLEALEHAKAVEPADPTAMTLATADARGRPSARMVLLKGADAQGFTFYTNHGSRKANELTQNPFAALCFHWPTLVQQVRIEGPVERVSNDESDAYFATRPRGSQIGAWASMQSSPLGDREELVVRVRAIEERYPGAVPRPPFWGGYRLRPSHMEFWFGQPSRLHDRFAYTREGAGWRMTRLSP